MKQISLYTLSLLAAFFLFTSCNEQEEAGEYDNWKERNQHYVDSIAYLADHNTDGWSKILAFNLDEEIEKLAPNNNHYVYIKKMDKGYGEYKPIFNDSVRVHYLGRLIPTSAHSQGYVFGKSYNTYSLNEATDVPALMSMNSNVTGFATATLHMVEGDNWKIVVPYYLGYGESESTSSKIPGYSTLIFDVKLAKVYRYKIDEDTTWH